ncbi:unnamed protein product [Diamesa tonsa]
MRMQRFIVLLLSCLVPNSLSKNVVYLYDVEYKFIPTVLNATFDMTLWANNSRKTPNRVLGGMQCELFQDLTNVFVQIKTTHIKSNQEKFGQTFNFCKFTKQRSTNIIFKTMFEDLEKSIDFKLECPFKKRIYFVEKYNFSDVFVPSFFKTNDAYSSALNFKTKIGKQMQSIFFWSLKWEIIDMKN